MLAKILGAIWIVMGLVWMLKPEILKNRLKRKMGRKLRWLIYGFIFMFGLLIIGSVIRAQGLLPKIVGIIGVFIIVKAILLFTSRASEKILGWWSEKPAIFFRIWALFIFVTGLMLIFV